LDLYYNQLTVLPPEIGNLSNLDFLDISDNQLTSLPLEIGSLSNLVELHLEDNPFTSPVPPSITNLNKLNNLSLSPCSGLTSSDPQVIAFLDARSPGWNQCP
jgi:Leucine-rich repeat (LRR) protein